MNQPVRVLVGDDNVDDRYFLKRGFNVTCPLVRLDFAWNGEAVIRYLEDTSHQKPSFMILDSMMSKIDGFAVVGWIRSKKEYDAVPLVMLSGIFYGKNAVRALDLGVEAYVEKPQDFPELLNLIDNWKQLYLTDSMGT